MNRSIVAGRLMLLLAVFMGLFSACTKNSDGGSSGSGDTYYVRFKVDGSQVDYSQPKNNFEDYVILSMTSFSSPNYLHTILGQKDLTTPSSKKNKLSVLLLTTKNLAPGISFSNYVSPSANYLGTVAYIFEYIDNAGVEYFGQGPEIAPYIFSSYGVHVVSDNIITFSEVNGTYVKGVFSGTMYNANCSVKKVITDGTFYLKLYK